MQVSLYIPENNEHYIAYKQLPATHTLSLFLSPLFCTGAIAGLRAGDVRLVGQAGVVSEAQLLHDCTAGHAEKEAILLVQCEHYHQNYQHVQSVGPGLLQKRQNGGWTDRHCLCCVLESQLQRYEGMYRSIKAEWVELAPLEKICEHAQ